MINILNGCLPCAPKARRDSDPVCFDLARASIRHQRKAPLLGLRAVQLDLAFAEIGFDAFELAQKIVPEYAAGLAVSDGLEAERPLLRDGVLL